jgi:hypothetical protein
MHLAACDQAKRNDLDGRGNLSEENLANSRASLKRSFSAVNCRAATLPLSWAPATTRPAA